MFTSPLTITGRRTTRPSPSRPTCRDRGRGLAGQPAVLRQDDRRELRQPAERRAVLSVLLDDDRQRHLHLAGGRRLHPRDDERLRRQLDHRVRPAAATVYPAPGLHDRDRASTTSTAATWGIRARRPGRALRRGSSPARRWRRPVSAAPSPLARSRTCRSNLAGCQVPRPSQSDGQPPRLLRLSVTAEAAGLDERALVARMRKIFPGRDRGDPRRERTLRGGRLRGPAGHAARGARQLARRARRRGAGAYLAGAAARRR